MAGISVSLLEVDDELLAGLDAPTTAPAWPHTLSATEGAVVPAPPSAPVEAGTLPATDPVRRALEAVAETLIAHRDELTELDREVGDGDLGISLARGAASVLAECPGYPGEQGPAAVLRAASATVRRSVGGTSGPLYAILLLRAAAALEVAGPDDPARAWSDALTAGTDGIRQVGGAEVGDRTMVDALAPAAAALSAALAAGVPAREALAAAVDAARSGSQGTTAIRARLGRSSYLGDRVIGHPDPGAHAVVLWLSSLGAAL
jgi:dihydroxyacetone kinase